MLSVPAAENRTNVVVVVVVANSVNVVVANGVNFVIALALMLLLLLLLPMCTVESD